MDSGYVYFLNAEGTNRYKIGLTADIDRRIKQLNAKQSAFPVVLLWQIEVDNMRAAEKYLHDLFSDYRVHGEWFEFSEQDLGIVEAAYAETERGFSWYPPNQDQFAQQAPNFVPSPKSKGIPIWLWVLLGFVTLPILFPANRQPAIVYSPNAKVSVMDSPNGKIVGFYPHRTKVSIVDRQNDWCKTEHGFIPCSTIEPQ